MITLILIINSVNTRSKKLDQKILKLCVARLGLRERTFPAIKYRKSKRSGPSFSPIVALLGEVFVVSIDTPLAKRVLNNGRLTCWEGGGRGEEKSGLARWFLPANLGHRNRNPRANQLTESHSNPVASAARLLFFTLIHLFHRCFANTRATEGVGGGAKTNVVEHPDDYIV